MLTSHPARRAGSRHEGDAQDAAAATRGPRPPLTPQQPQHPQLPAAARSSVASGMGSSNRPHPPSMLEGDAGSQFCVVGASAGLYRSEDGSYVRMPSDDGDVLPATLTAADLAE